jgi:PAS domain S-box-containing protein
MTSESIAAAAMAAAPVQRNLLLHSLEQMLLATSGTGEELFRNLVRYLAKATQAKYALIGELKRDAPDTVRTLAVWSGEGISDNFEYSLSGTPCEDVMQQRVCYYPSGIQESFPQDILLAQMGVHTYLGVPLTNKAGQGIGLLVLLNDGPLPEPEIARLLLEICSTRAAAELDRGSYGNEDPQKTMQWMLDNFGMVLDCIQEHAAFRLDLEGRVLGWNPGAARIYGYTDLEVIGKPVQMLWRQPEQFKDLMEQAQSASKAERESDQCHKSGKMFPAHVFLRRSTVLNGAPGEFVLIVRNLAHSILLDHGLHIVQMLAFREPVERVLAYITGLLENIFPDMRVAIMLLSEDDKRLTCASAPSLPAKFIEELEGAPLYAESSPCGAAISRRRTVTSTSVSTDPIWGNLRSAAFANEVRACWSNPIISAGGKVLGTVDLYYNRPCLPGELDQAMMDRTVGSVAIAVQYMRDAQAQEKVKQQQLRLMQNLVSAEEEARRRIARELHDSTGQLLTSLLLQLRALQKTLPEEKSQEEIERLRKTTSDALADLRRILQGLHPSALDDFGLAPALRRYASDLGRTAGLKINFFTDGMQDWRPAQMVETAIYRATQEIMNNVVKHAHARNAQLFIKRENEELRVVVSDDGIGFNLDEAVSGAAKEHHLGLLGIRNRMEMLGGSMEIDSHPGQGTTVSLRIPSLEIA